MKRSLLISILLVAYQFNAQTIVSENFENSVTLFTNSGGIFYTGNSASGDRPASSPFAQLNVYGIGVTNGTATLTTSDINTSTCSDVQLSFKLSAFSMGSTGNGMEASDYVSVEISPDGGTTYYNTLQVNGNGNAYWAYATGTGTATTTYDGNVTAVNFAPSAGGNRTTDGYSTLIITSLPIVANLRIRIILLNNATAERWVMDNFVLSGSCTSCTTPTITVNSSQTTCTNVATNFTVASNATSPTYTWQASTNGTTGWANAINGTPTGVSYTGINTFSLGITGTSAVNSYYRILVTEGGTCTATSGTSTLIINSSPIINTQPTSVATTTSGSGTFNVSALSGALTYQWQQNSGSGFSNITNGGSNPTYAGATNAALTISNPPLSMSGYSYQCIVANSCGTITTNGTATLNITTALRCPHLTGVQINACAGACQEGDNEVVFFNSGDYAIPVSSSNIVLKYGPSFPPTIIYSNPFTTNPTTTSSLNTNAGCGTLFLDAVTTGTIPANSVFIMVRNTLCYNYDFSAFCGLGNIYILYSTDADWVVGGNFGNYGTSALRYFRTDFTAIGAGCVADYNYNRVNLYDGDGAAISFLDAGAASSYFNSGCDPSPQILPIELLNFYATRIQNQNEITWKVAQEENIAHYLIEKSNNAINFTEVGVVIPNDNIGYKTYSLIDETPFNDMTYYRLSTKELEGSIINHKIISIDNKDVKWKYSYYQLENDLHIDFKNNLPKQTIINLYDITGKIIITQKVEVSQNTINTAILAKGLYFVQITTPYKTENFKVAISNPK